jgi:DNA polymerase III epsilon subunit family exonuclease
MSVGGVCPAMEVVESVLGIANASEEIAARIAAELVTRDPRIILLGNRIFYNEPETDSIELAEGEFVVLDLETTGAKAPPCKITEIGAYKVKQGRIVGEFHSLVNPETPIPEFITSLTGISDEMVAGAPRFRDLSIELLDFVGESVLVAHNASFDLGFLDYEIRLTHGEVRLGNPSICTVQLSRRLLQDIPNHKLRTVAEHFGIELVNHHRAGEDALATAKIFINLLEELQGRGIKDLGGLRSFIKNTKYVRPKRVAA